MLLKVVGIIHIVFYVINGATSQGWAIDDDGCRTPDLGVGTCILAKDCGSMVSFLKMAPSPLPSHLKEKLREYVCGYSGRKVKICCSDEPVSLMLSSRKVTDQPVKADSVENHKNIGLLPEECGYIGIPDKISYGENAGLGEYPWMALLSYKTESGPSFQCGGTVINDKYILTAAHCITELQTPIIGVRVGDYDTSTKVDCEKQDDGTTKCVDEPVQDLFIEKIIPHPNFTKEYENENGFNDIGLLRVKGMKLADNVQPICLPTGVARNAELGSVIITGWGFTEKQPNTQSTILKKVIVPVISQKKCQKSYQTIRVSEKQICANGKQKDSCNGDSGGPLQTAKFLNDESRMVQYGVISFGGAICGAGTHPGLYTRVESYMKWILDNIEP
ncbi:melanization protease 1-like [Anoplophora glabripennis]|uniref:melanization protease 1-like n=1 Tax=Anoplophora glabripennis TaxID=217634 RepID=UPI0008737461|nr:melanization protease 1-like [Anoplophora glabripennis]